MVTNGTHQILVVEDETSIAKVLEQKLQDSGYEVIMADNGVEAMELTKKHHPDLILLDVVMPLMNGFDFLQNLRVKQKNGVPVIIISNLEMEDDVQAGKNLGATEYIVKSNISMRSLMNTVEKALA